MIETFHSSDKPEIIVSDADQRRLTILATNALDRVPEVAEELLAEMERARVVPAESVPPNTVRMDSTVVYRADDGRERQVKLVFPGQADIAEGKISILTPIGTALIGLTEGQSISWLTRDGHRRTMTVLRVEASASDGSADADPGTGPGPAAA